MKLLLWAMLASVALSLAVFAAGRAGWLAGSPVSEPGVRNGRLSPPAMDPNSVSSQADLYPGHPQLEYARIAPLAYSGDGTDAMARLASVIRQMDGTHIERETPDYLYVQFRTPWLRFVDDVEFWHNPANGVIELRSASRLGKSDLGLNRQRIEMIRQRFKP